MPGSDDTRSLLTGQFWNPTTMRTMMEAVPRGRFFTRDLCETDQMIHPPLCAVLPTRGDDRRVRRSDADATPVWTTTDS